ncbi:MAG: UDP-N-acetylmuramoyl-tripeptide--D-alanyl-D-alanine ligase [Spirochaetaceae bacterium]|jgi:UDP-N-acetylmuramoyl-tripeptide--D-alanyl-D-alanine ligase|nr:UDP-N-acetylmuramoyl-tripeptide--D-alanyl-D-alanine ligase [Spirochaetaceae bacterium]
MTPAVSVSRAPKILLTFDEASKASGAGLVKAGEGSPPAGFSGVCADSRKAGSGFLFAALKGEKTDGHDFIIQALEKGACGLLLQKDKRSECVKLASSFFSKQETRSGTSSCVMLFADDVLRALQASASFYLKKYKKLTRIGITGSSGKTTTKEIAAKIFSREKNVVYNEGNLNSDVGLSLSVFQVNESHEVGVFEMGMNRKGEMASLAAVLNPQAALITNVGTAHAGFAGGRDGVAREKKAAFSRFSGEETAFIPKNAPYSDFLAEGVNGRVVFYDVFSTFTDPKQVASGFFENAGVEEKGLNGSRISWNGVSADFALAGRHNVENALAAMTLAKERGVSDEAIARGLEEVKPLFGRGEIVRGRVTLVRDCYNANPDSMKAAIDFCDSAPAPRRLYVLGEMLELGDVSAEAHKDLAKRLCASKADAVFLFGEEMKQTEVLLREMKKDLFVFHTNDINDLSRAVSNAAENGCLVLLKGSRRCELERVEGAL